MKNALGWLIFVAAASLEISGDALIRKGLRGSGIALIIAGFAMLGCYGIIVNLVKWDFSKMLGVYVAFFAFGSIMFGRFAFREHIPTSTWVGMAIIIMGGLIIQFGSK
jgi:small multidrug resistance family-3 protein